MTELSIKINNLPEIKEAFKRAPEQLTKELNKAVARIITKLHAESMHNAPVNKQSGGGSLRQSIKSRMTGIAKGEIVAEAKYAAAVHEGTVPHVIRVATKKVLANKRTGQIFGRVVQHPGTKAQPFMQQAIDETEKFTNDELVEAVGRAV